MTIIANHQPEAAQRVVEAVVDAALARCAREGIAEKDFYQAMIDERKISSTGDLPDLVRRIFARLNATSGGEAAG